MKINHNISGLNTLNKIMGNNTKVNKSLQKLSSGLRINQAADDSAGLAISEKMRAQIKGLEQAEQNIEDGISLVDTADSGLSVILDPNLIRLRELAVQAANDTLSTEDRQIIQKEVNQILEGINDIVDGTDFNTIKLLNGAKPGTRTSQGGNPSFTFENVLKVPPVDANGSFLFGTNEGYPTTDADDNQTLVYGTGNTSIPSVRIDGNSYNLNNVKQSTVEANGSYNTVYEVINNDIDVEVTQSVRIVEDKYEIKYTIKNNSDIPFPIGFQFHLDTMLGGDDNAPFVVNGSPVAQQTVYDGSSVPNDFIVYNQNTGEGANAEFQGHGIIKGKGIIEQPSKFAIGQYNDVSNWDFNSNIGSVGDSGYSIWWNPRDIASGESFSVNTFYGQSIPPTIDDPTVSIDEGPFDLILQTGANAQNQFLVQLADVRTEKLEINDLSVLTQQEAEQAISKVDQAVEIVTSERTKFGAYNNVLTHMKNNVSNYRLNVSASESQLKDLNIAKEITKLANTRVVLQASQSMLAQSNQVSQSVLEFLK